MSGQGGKILRLPDLVTLDRPVLSDQHFRGQLIVGPGLLYPFDSTFDGCEWTVDFDSAFWPIAPGRDRVVGAVFVERCTFVDCVFNGVGIAAPEGERDRYRQLWP